MRRILWLMLGLVVGVAGAAYWVREPLERLQTVEAQLKDVHAQLDGIEGSLAKLPTRLDDVRIELRRVADLVDPVDAASRSGDDSLYVATRPGRIYAIDTKRPATDPTLFLDISRLVDTQNAKRGRGSEPGFLGLAFSPEGDFLYVTFTGPGDGTDESLTWTLVEFEMEGDEVDVESRRRLMSVRKRYPTHNGGDIQFGPDGYLYVSIGDGSPFRDLLKTGQDRSDLLGSLLRVDPRPGAHGPYSVPRDNPFVEGGGAAEVWAYGLRNPWRFAFDRVTGDLWIADVGEREEEEVNRFEASDGGGRGANLGWSRVEGTHVRDDDEPEDHVAPLYVYKRRRPFCAIIGGFIYRGGAIPALRGAYLYSDYCDGTIKALAVEGDEVTARSLDLEIEAPSSFAEDANGELYVISFKGDVFRIEPA